MESEAPKTTKKFPLIPVLLAVIIILLISFGYFFFVQKNKTTVTEKVTETTQTTEVTGTQPINPTETGTQPATDTQAGTQTNGTGTTIAKADIDGDLKSLDTLDLSKIESDYSEDNVNDLTQ